MGNGEKRSTELNENKTLLVGVLDSSLSGIMAFKSIRNAEGAIMDFEWQLINAAAEQMVSRSQTEIVGKRMLEEMPGNRSEGLFDLYVRVVETGIPLSHEHYYEHEKVKMWFRTVAIKRLDGFVVTFSNITEQKLAIQELIIANKELAYQNKEKEKRAAELIIANKELAFQNKEKEKRAAELIIANKELVYLGYHDFLTDLYNRTYFEEEKNRLDTKRQLPISIIMGDINGLKLINDGFGHSKGDEVLIGIAKILKSCCREEDIVSRIGGDEFGILLPKTDSQSAHLVCSRISDACKEYALNESSIYPSISVGHATKNIEAETMDNIFIAAEEAMSKQKLLESGSAHSSIIASIKAIMFEKSQETEEHAERLIQLSKSIGLAMSLTDDQLNELELLSTLHDIGKMSIPVNILSKRGELSNKEWKEMRKHPEVGFRIAQATSELIPIAKYILCHHERWDGKGYPQGLMGEKIPLLSRIVAIVDSFDAMISDRPYRSAMTKGEAIEEIRRNSGCFLISFHSSLLSFPRFNKILAGILILPISCNVDNSSSSFS